MIIPMKHPLHGTKIAIAEEEAVADEKNGWVRYELAALLIPAQYKEPAQQPVEKPQFDELSTLREKYREKFGKPPHHKLGLERLRDMV